MSLDVGTLEGRIELDIQPVDTGLSYVVRQLQNFEQRAGQAGSAAASALGQGMQQGAQQGNAAAERASLGLADFIRRSSSTGIADGIAQGSRAGTGEAEADARRLAEELEERLRRGADEGIAEGARAGAAEGSAAGDQMGADLAEKLKGAIIGAGIGATFVAAMGIEDGNAKLQAQLGITAEEAGQAGRLAGDLWTGNYAESMDEARDLTRSTIAALGTDSKDFAGKETAKFAGYASNLAGMTGEEADSVLQLVSRMMRTYGTTATEAFDVVTKASQRTTAGMQGDLLDVGNEYAGVFNQVGLSASEAFAMLADASKDGSIAMDKVGDSVKEFTLLATNLDDTGEAYERLGLNGKQMSNDLLAGGDSARAAMKAVVDGLLSVQDPSEQAALAIKFFGTPLEDLGTDQIPTFLGSLAAAEEGLGKVTGAASEADKVLGSTIGGRFATLGKEAMGTGTAVAESLLPAFEALMPIFQAGAELLGEFSDNLAGLPTPLLLAGAGAIAFGIALRKASTEAGSLRGGLGSLAKTIGNGGMFAVAALAVSELVEDFGRAGKIASEVAVSTGDITAALVENGVQWDKNIAQMQEAAIVGSTHYQTMIDAGLSHTEAMEVAAGGFEKHASKLKSLISVNWYGGLDMDKLDEIETWSNNVAGQKNRAITEATQQTDAKQATADAEEMAFMLDRAKVSATGAATEVAKIPDAVEEIDPEPVNLMTAAMEGYTEETGQATDETSLYMAALESLVDGTVSVDTATRAAAAANREMGAAARDTADAIAKKGEADAAVTKLVEEGKEGTAEYEAALRAQADAADAVADAADGQADSFISAADAERVLISSSFQANTATMGLSGALNTARSQAQAARDSLINQAMAAGMSADEANNLADELGLIPDDVVTNLRQTGKDAMVQAAIDVKTEMGGIKDKSITLTMYTSGLSALYTMTDALNSAAAAAARASTSGVSVASSPVTIARAGGGGIYGPGPKGVDSVPAILAPGEHVLTDREVDALGGQEAVYRMRRGIMSGTLDLPRFARGGAVGGSPASAGAGGYAGAGGRLQVDVTGTLRFAPGTDGALAELISRSVVVEIDTQVRELVGV